MHPTFHPGAGVRRAIAAGCVAVSLACAAGVASAAPITYYFSGTVSGSGGTGTVLAAQDFSGSFTYDPASPATPGGGSSQRYSPLLAPGLTAAIGADTAAAGADDPRGVNQMWNVGASTYGIPAATGHWLQFGSGVQSATGALQGYLFLVVSLVDTNGDAGFGVVGDAPPALLDLSTLEHTSFALASPNLLNFAFGALACLSTTQSDCVETPEPIDAPPTLPLLALGLAALALSRRRPR